MKKFQHEELKNNEVFTLIVNSFYKDISNFGHSQYGETFRDEGFYKNVSLILNNFYRLKNKLISVIQFKQDFSQLKNKAENGTITIKDKEGKEKIHVNYSGDFVYYSVLIYTLFYKYFYKEIEAKEKVIGRVEDIIRDNYQELKNNPINDRLIQVVSRIFNDSDFSHQDVADYMDLLLDELKSHYVFEEESSEAALIEIDAEELETVGTKIMLMKELGIVDLLIENYDLKSKSSQISKIISAFTGMKFSTVNGIINPIFNSANNQKNNPYQNPENVLNVKAMITKLGLK